MASALPSTLAGRSPGPSFLSIPTDLWSLLGEVRDFSVRVLYPAAAGMRLSHEGAGVVEVTRHRGDGEERVEWRETGRWLSGPLAGIAFHNATLWRRQPGSEVVVLSHLRRGVDQPTPLVVLRPDSATSLLSVTPHLCGPDRYAARLTSEARALQLTWEVESPTDPYRLEWTGRPCRLFSPSSAL